MRSTILITILAACDPASGRPASPPPGVTGIVFEDDSAGGSTSDRPRLDLADVQALRDLPAEDASSSTGASAAGEASTTGPDPFGSTGQSTTEAATSDDGSTSTGAASTSGETTTGEPAPVCDDGVCDPAERAPCWSPGWCQIDCAADPACLSDCPCTPGAAATKNFCSADPKPACVATAPGGYCDPDGDGSPVDGDFTRGFVEWSAKCG